MIIAILFSIFLLSALFMLPQAASRIRALFAQANRLDLMWFLLFVSLHLGSSRTAGELTDEPIDTVRLARMSLLLTVECCIVASILIRKRPLARLLGGVQRFMILYTITQVATYKHRIANAMIKRTIFSSNPLDVTA